MAELYDDTPKPADPIRVVPPGTVRFEAPYGAQRTCPHCHHEMRLDAVLVSRTFELDWVYQCPIHGTYWTVRLLS